MKKSHIQTINSVMGMGNLSQLALSRLLGVTPGCVNNWLCSRSNPSRTNLEAVRRLQRIFEAKDKAMRSKVFQISPKQPTGDSIAIQAHKIVNERAEEKQRQYGDFGECMQRATNILRAMTRDIDLPDNIMYHALVALKLSREGYKHKTDNLMDAMAYMQALENFENGKNED